MELRIRALFSRRKSSSKTRDRKNSRKSRFGSQSYDSAIALDPPVQGSYPVAGNGLNVLDEIHKARERRQSESTVGYANAPNVPRRRENVGDRPSTAPHNGLPSGHAPARNPTGRTFSGFKAKAPPSFLQRQSIETTRRHAPPPISNGIRQIQSYQQPKRMPEGGYVPISAVPHPRPPQHGRNESTASSRASYVDILDAHSTIARSRDLLQNRVTASGIRSYGEDVADRNIAVHCARDQFDLTSPHYSYMQKIYSPGRTFLSNVRDAAAFDHALDSDAGGDETPPYEETQPIFTSPLAPRPSQTHPATLRSLTGTRPGYAYPSRTDSKSGNQDSRGRNDVRSYNRRSRTMSPTAAAATIEEEPPSPTNSRQSLQYPNTPTPPIPERGRNRPLSKDFTAALPLPSVSHSRQNTFDSALSSKQAVNLSRRSTISIDTSNNIPIANESRTRPRPSSLAPIGSQIHTKNKRASLYSLDERDLYNSPALRSPVPVSLNNRYSFDTKYQSDPSTIRSTPRTSISNHSRSNLAIEGATKARSLDGIIDLTETADTEVITKKMPAVTNEYGTPKVQRLREDFTLREFDTNDVSHRVSPPIKTETPPPKYYVQSTDGKTLIEISADEIQGRIPARPASNKSIPDESISHITNIPNNEGSALPMISRTRKSITQIGIPRTESGMRHHRHSLSATLENGNSITGNTIPMYLDDGYSDDDAEAEAEDEATDFDNVQMSGPTVFQKTEEDLLFRDSGYGSGGMLPGLVERARRPTSAEGLEEEEEEEELQKEEEEVDEGSEDEEEFGFRKVVDYMRTDSEVPTMHALRRRKEAKERLRRAYEEEGIAGIQKSFLRLAGGD